MAAPITIESSGLRGANVVIEGHGLSGANVVIESRGLSGLGYLGAAIEHESPVTDEMLSKRKLIAGISGAGGAVLAGVSLTAMKGVPKWLGAILGSGGIAYAAWLATNLKSKMVLPWEDALAGHSASGADRMSIRRPSGDGASTSEH